MGVAVIITGWVLLQMLYSESVIRVSTIVQMALAALAILLIERFLHFKVPSWKKEVAFLAMALTGAAVAWTHAKYLDPAYLRAGRRDKF